MALILAVPVSTLVALAMAAVVTVGKPGAKKLGKFMGGFQLTSILPAAFSSVN